MDLESAKKPFYNLMMFPYPSAEGLHVGNMYAFTAADIYGRFKMMQGFDVFEPIGLDGFGIHSENFALKIGRHPMEHAKITEKNFYAQLHKVGNMYDWSKTVETYDPDYYRWTQWIFVQMYKAGLAYRATSKVNWCPKCKTVLADEQVIDGKCERCSTETIKKALEQWFFRITKYAQRLLDNLEGLDWSEKVKISQRNWIGRSEGVILNFKATNPKSQNESISVFTTRPDTVHGATFVAVATQASSLKSQASKEKIGKFTGRYVLNPATGNKIPVWRVNYVDESYGTGAIMGVPAHDTRDREFANKYGIDIVEMEPDEKWWKRAEEEGWGKRETHYHLRDWLISRQRYWGPPIPMIKCPKCDWQPVAEDQLPVLLPEIDDYQPEGEGKGPLAKHKEFYETKCPKCGGVAVRETDVSDTFLDSAWYFLRYPSVGKDSVAWDKELTKKWLPVDMYTGGPEHSNLHLLYTRFLTMALKDMGHLDFEEPFKRFFAHGMLIKDGAKMSKSKGNVINPDEYIEKYGVDAVRMYLMFLGPVDQGGDFRDTGMEGMTRFIRRLAKIPVGEDKPALERGLHRLVKKVGEDIERRHYNTAISAIMEFVNSVFEVGGLGKDQAGVVWRLMAPMAPYLAEEMWERLGGEFSVHQQRWPEYDPKLILEEKATVVVQVNSRVREKLVVDKETDAKTVEQLALASDKVKKYVEGKKYRVVFVPGKILNLVIDA
ncbi:MAG: leucyl-tRNA synthetase [Microgenomates group bacterium Gr01-1014_16]|nr:MAG: leucyl-tRNA synthetase [Microgenomates group bacterium Gr01-1014_16]